MSEAQIVTDIERELKTPSSAMSQRLEEAANEVDPGQVTGIRSSLENGMQTTVLYMLTLLIIYIGWQYRGNVYITPEEGPGYVLGISGGSMLLLLLVYPMRKHMRWMRRLGPVSHWFRIHMLLGIIGPVCILYHCNYQLGSTNGNIALFSMLLVAGSGLVGRYFYTKIHYGLYGRKAELVHLGSDMDTAKSLIHMALEASPGLRARLQRLEMQATAEASGFLTSMARVIGVAIKTHWCWITSGPALRKALSKSTWGGEVPASRQRRYYQQARQRLHVYLATVRKVAGLAFYERLFSVWHILHLPLFFMLLISGFVHVYAVHVY